MSIHTSLEADCQPVFAASWFGSFGLRVEGFRGVGV